jgi:hypothetical protein
MLCLLNTLDTGLITERKASVGSDRFPQEPNEWRGCETSRHLRSDSFLRITSSVNVGFSCIFLGDFAKLVSPKYQSRTTTGCHAQSDDVIRNSCDEQTWHFIMFMAFHIVSRTPSICKTYGTVLQGFHTKLSIALTWNNYGSSEEGNWSTPAHSTRNWLVGH